MCRYIYNEYLNLHHMLRPYEYVRLYISLSISLYRQIYRYSPNGSQGAPVVAKRLESGALVQGTSAV